MAHTLGDLQIESCSTVFEVLPTLDLYHLEACRRISLAPDVSDTDRWTLEVQATYSDASGSYLVTISFLDVRLVKLPELNPPLWFGELEVEDVSARQLEGVRFEVRDHGMSEFEVLCKRIQVDAIVR